MLYVYRGNHFKETQKRKLFFDEIYQNLVASAGNNNIINGALLTLYYYIFQICNMKLGIVLLRNVQPLLNSYSMLYAP